MSLKTEVEYYLLRKRVEYRYNERKRLSSEVIRATDNNLSVSQNNTNNATEEKLDEEELEAGRKFTKKGPAPFVGDILEDPDLVWAEDHWTKEREEAAEQKLKEQGQVTISEYWREHYVEKAAAYWHKFYKRNQDHFFKDRHYLHIVFPELNYCSTNDNQQIIRLLEIGCGVGNAILPLAEINPNLEIIAMDLATSAIGILKENVLYKSLNEAKPGRIQAYVNDIVNDKLPEPCSPGSMDIVMNIFAISAIAPKHHRDVFQKIFDCLKPGGKLLFRDYAKYDEAQLRFKQTSKLDDNFYVRHDGTCSYFFHVQELQQLVEDIGFACEELEVISRQYANRQQKQARYRNWIHAKFVKK